MFNIPLIPQPSEALIDVSESLRASSNQLENLVKFQKEQFTRFWFKGKTTLKTPEEINERLSLMDSAQPGQSYKYFIVAKALVDFIEVLEPGRLQPEDWYPKFEYAVDPVTFSLRVVAPPVEEPTEGGEQI